MAMEVGECLSYIMGNVDLNVEGGFAGRSRKLVRLSSISSINITGSPDSGSRHEPKYWMTFGCFNPLRNSISCSKRCTMR